MLHLMLSVEFVATGAELSPEVGCKPRPPGNRRLLGDASVHTVCKSAARYSQFSSTYGKFAKKKPGKW